MSAWANCLAWSGRCAFLQFLHLTHFTHLFTGGTFMLSVVISFNIFFEASLLPEAPGSNICTSEERIVTGVEELIGRDPDELIGRGPEELICRGPEDRIGKVVRASTVISRFILLFIIVLLSITASSLLALALPLRIFFMLYWTC